MIYRNAGESERRTLHVKVYDDVDGKRGTNRVSHVTVVRPGAGIFEQVFADAGLFSNPQRRDRLERLLQEL